MILDIAIQFHQHRAEDKLAQHNYTAAAKEHIAWSWLEPENQSIERKIAEIHIFEGEPHRAYYRLQPLLKAMTTDDFEMCRLMALIQIDREHVTAMDWSRRLLASASSPNQIIESKVIAAHANRMMNQIQDANAGYSEVLRHDPDHPEANYYLSSAKEQKAILKKLRGELKMSRFGYREFNCTPEFYLKAIVEGA